MMIFKKFWAGSFLFHIDLKLMKKMLPSTCLNRWKLYQQMVEGIELSSTNKNKSKKNNYLIYYLIQTVEQHKISILDLEYNLMF